MVREGGTATLSNAIIRENISVNAGGGLDAVGSSADANARLGGARFVAIFGDTIDGDVQIFESGEEAAI